LRVGVRVRVGVGFMEMGLPRDKPNDRDVHPTLPLPSEGKG